MNVVVIGGGIAGVSAAYHLARSGADVTVLEQEATLAFHSTGRSAALYFENYGAEANRPLTRASRSFFENPTVGLVDHLVLGEPGGVVGRETRSDRLASRTSSTSPTGFGSMARSRRSDRNHPGVAP